MFRWHMEQTARYGMDVLSFLVALLLKLVLERRAVRCHSPCSLFPVMIQRCLGPEHDLKRLPWLRCCWILWQRAGCLSARAALQRRRGGVRRVVLAMLASELEPFSCEVMPASCNLESRTSPDCGTPQLRLVALLSLRQEGSRVDSESEGVA